MSSLRCFFCAAFLCAWADAAAVEAVVSCAVFHRTARNGDDSAYAEISWQITPSSLHYKKSTTGELVSQIQTALTIANDTSILTRDRYVLETQPLQPSDASKQKIIQVRRYPLPPGTWRLQLALGETSFQKEAFIYKDTLTVPVLATPSLSAIQLLDTFVTSDVPSPFLKNGAQQLPLPLNFLENGRRYLHIYNEAYTAKDLTGKTIIRYFYLSKRQMDVPFYDVQYIDTLTGTSGIHPFLHSFNIGRLSSGNYYLNVFLKDEAGNRLASTSAFFQLINKQPDPAPVAVADTSKSEIELGRSNYFNLANTFVAKFTSSQLGAILKMILPQADVVEANTINNFFKRPDDMYTRYFIYNYFGKYNKAHPGQAWKEFSDLIREVNRDFNAGGFMGYETERGIIYLKYGKPDERIRVVNESGALPYEVWRYNTIGKTSQVGLFLFYQAGNTSGDFRLLHSTAPGERYNPSWKASLYMNGQSSSMGNSRAEQYFEGK
jgi:GWxTD domain-containing protein